jgi:microcystin-dependent protein
MTVEKTDNRKDYTAGAPPNNKIYAFDFKIYDETDLLVYVNGGTPKVLNTDYTVSGGPTWTESGGNVTFVDSLTAGDAVLIYRELTITQGTHWPEGDSFPSASHENAADRLVMLAQQFKEAIGRVFKVVISSLLTNIEVPEGAGKLWGWNALGTGAALYNQIIDTGVITTKGDLVIGSAAGIAERKAIGAQNQIATVAGGTVVWAAPAVVKLDDAGMPDDNTDLNVSITKHGLTPKAPNDTNKFLRGDGTWDIVPPFPFPGVVVAYVGSVAPDGWLVCDGSAKSQTTYSALFGIIGLVYGDPGGGNFTLPDLRQKFPMGKAVSGTGSTLGEKGGAINLPHTHTISTTPTNSAAGAALTLSDANVTGTSPTLNPPYQVVNFIIKY